MQEQWPLWNGHVYAPQVPAVPPAQMSGGRHAGAVWVPICQMTQRWRKFRFHSLFGMLVYSQSENHEINIDPINVGIEHYSRSPCFLTFRCAFWGTNQTKEDEKAAGGGNSSHIHSGHPHPPTGSSYTGSTAAGDDWEAGGHAEAMQQEVISWPTKSDSKWTSQRIDLGLFLIICHVILTIY